VTRESPDGLMRVVGVVQQPEGVRQNVQDCIKLFDAAIGASRSVDDDRATPDASKAARETAERIAESHRFGQAWRFSFDHGLRPLGGLVARCETGAAGRHDETGKLIGHLGQCGRNVASAVSSDAMLNDVEAGIRQEFDQRRPTFVDTCAVDDTVATGQHLRLLRGQCVAHEVRR
jgi:hypothetical protein